MKVMSEGKGKPDCSFEANKENTRCNTFPSLHQLLWILLQKGTMEALQEVPCDPEKKDSRLK